MLHILDILMIYSFSDLKTKIEKIAKKLNNVESSINFTKGKEANNTMLLVDILIIKSQKNLTF